MVAIWRIWFFLNTNYSKIHDSFVSKIESVNKKLTTSKQNKTEQPWALTRWFSWLEPGPIHQKAAGDLIPSRGAYRRQLFNASRSLSQINIHILRWGLKNSPLIEKKAVYTKKPGELIGNESVIFWLNTKSKIQMFKYFIYNSSNQSENSGLSLKHL